MGRRFESTVRLEAVSSRVWEALPAAFEAAGIEVLDADAATLELRGKKKEVSTAEMSGALLGGGSSSRISAAKTFGEKVTATVADEASGSSVTVERRLRFGLIDWGENKKNVENILGALRSKVDPG